MHFKVVENELKFMHDGNTIIDMVLKSHMNTDREFVVICVKEYFFRERGEDALFILSLIHF